MGIRGLFRISGSSVYALGFWATWYYRGQREAFLQFRASITPTTILPTAL